MRSTMKTVLCLVLVLVTLFCMSACSTGDAPNHQNTEPLKEYITGRYELEKIQWADGTVATGNTLQDAENAMGDMYVELFSDRTAQLALFGQILDMEFSDDKMWQINYSSNTYDFSVGSGRVVLKQAGDTFTFVKK